MEMQSYPISQPTVAWCHCNIFGDVCMATESQYRADIDQYVNC